ncbi:multidrug/biocide efflux PACE transporter [Buttiauxella selenatireducens]|uniref:Multidrug/biocide efflux PACE transporter n=1 Tax=Buttiauxella selenatireducens TaxID=3073902 RepID=A0ABY9S5M0_9ENTR|nr:multidrug/biocide efflux PACE transporter [Buttiauxella sp. R73]WMY72308.1 multidrug/biocide efflux PACE transporter [Buttiauxella sp. R73]
MQSQKRTFAERIVHAVGFEVIAIAICAPVAAWIMDKPLFQMGALSIMLSTVAMVWNMIYNAGFDKFFPVGQKRRVPLRVAHAVGFEGGFILIGLPIAAWMLDITLLQAFMVEIGFFLFFLPYSVVYNWGYDALRARRFQHLAQR